MKRNSFVYIFKVVQVSKPQLSWHDNSNMMMPYMILFGTLSAYNSWGHCNDGLPSHKDASEFGGGWSDLPRCHVSWASNSSVQWVCWACYEYRKASHILQTKRPSLLSIMGIRAANMDSENSHILSGVCGLDRHDILCHWFRSKHWKVRGLETNLHIFSRNFFAASPQIIGKVTTDVIIVQVFSALPAASLDQSDGIWTLPAPCCRWEGDGCRRYFWFLCTARSFDSRWIPNFSRYITSHSKARQPHQHNDNTTVPIWQ